MGRKAMEILMNNEQKKETRKLPGFYIAVCCCVLAIGAAGYFTQREEAKHTSVAVNDQEDSNPIYTPEPIATALPTKIPVSSIPEAEPIITEQPAEEAVSTSVQAAIADDYTLDNPDLEASITVSAEEAVSFVKPAAGEILSQYSDKPVYNEALDDWRTHDGVDIAVNEGGSVCAAADGTVSEIGYNVMGCTVTITHNDGYTTKYMQLESANEVQEGAADKKGDVIGVIGKSTAETVKEPHLHFEIYKDGTCLNPAEAIQ